jgi:hypothetical protein
MQGRLWPITGFHAKDDGGGGDDDHDFVGYACFLLSPN